MGNVKSHPSSGSSHRKVNISTRPASSEDSSHRIQSPNELTGSNPTQTSRSLVHLQIKYEKLVRQMEEENVAHEKVVGDLEKMLESNSQNSKFEKQTVFVGGVIAGLILGAIFTPYVMTSTSVLGSCASFDSSPQLSSPLPIHQSNDNQDSVMVSFAGPSIFSFSNVMYMTGAFVILSSFGFQMFKLKDSTAAVIPPALSLAYCGIFLVAAENLYPLPSSQLVGGCYYMIATFLVGVAGLCALGSLEKSRSSQPHLKGLVDSFFSFELTVPSVTPVGGDVWLLLAPILQLSVVFASVGGLAFILYRRTVFPGLLFPVFLGAYGTFVVACGCLHVALVSGGGGGIRFSWVTFAFGLGCAVLLLRGGAVASVAEDEVLRLSLTLSALNCCVPTLPLLLAQQMGLASFDQWKPFLKDMKQVTHASMMSTYRAAVCVVYAYLNIALLGASPRLGTWLHVPYVLASLVFMTTALLGNYFFMISVGVPFALICVAMPSILLSLRDEAVYSILHWLGNPELLSSILLHTVRLSCGVLGIVTLLIHIVRMYIPDLTLKTFPVQATSPLAALLLCAVSAELAVDEPVVVAMVYHLLASLFFVIGLLLLLVKTDFENDKPSIPKTLLVLGLSYRFVVNGRDSSVMSLTGAMCMASCLFSLYFLDMIVTPAGNEPNAMRRGERASKVSSQLKGALKRAAAVNIAAGLFASVIMCFIAVGQNSSLLAWIGIIGVYAFFASIVLRMSNDWVNIASAVTLIGCLTIYTGMQLDTMVGQNSTSTAAMPIPGGEWLSLLARPLETGVVHSAVLAIKDVASAISSA